MGTRIESKSGALFKCLKEEEKKGKRKKKEKKLQFIKFYTFIYYLSYSFMKLKKKIKSYIIICVNEITNCNSKCY